jgi:hypothetical protein
MWATTTMPPHSTSTSMRADGRVSINTASRRMPLRQGARGFGVTTTPRGAGSVIFPSPLSLLSTSPIRCNGTLQASDFTVNGTSANSVSYTAVLMTMTFNFNTTPVVAGPADTHIAAGAFPEGPQW